MHVKIYFNNYKLIQLFSEYEKTQIFLPSKSAFKLKMIMLIFDAIRNNAEILHFDPITLMCGIIYWLLIQHTVSMEQLYGGIHPQECLIIPSVLTVGQR